MCSDGSLNACALYAGQGGHAVQKVATQAAHRAAPDPPWRGCHIYMRIRDPHAAALARVCGFAGHVAKERRRLGRRSLPHA